MAYDDVLDDAVTTAEERGTLDYSDPEEREAFDRAIEEIMRDADGNERDSFPSSSDIDKDEWPSIFAFLDEYDLWDQFREDWEEEPSG